MTKEVRAFLFFATLSIVTAVGICVTTVNVIIFASSQKVMAATVEVADPSEALLKEKLYWLDIITDYPTYRDAYIELVDIEIRLGNRAQAKEFLEKAEKIDPNSPLISSLKEKIN